MRQIVASCFHNRDQPATLDGARVLQLTTEVLARATVPYCSSTAAAA